VALFRTAGDTLGVATALFDCMCLHRTRGSGPEMLAAAREALSAAEAAGAVGADMARTCRRIVASHTG
jgi:hypothetical protein